MAVPRRIAHYLYFHDIDFRAIQQDENAVAQGAAPPSCPQARNIARVVVVRTEDSYYMLVLPRGRAVRIDSIRQTLQLPHCRLATESEIADIFPDCEAGAVPALGNLYDVPVVLDETFGKDENICFSGGTRQDLLLMRYCDFAELTQASVVSLQSH